MPYVITVDQRASRTARDLVDEWVQELNAQFGPRLMSPFARTIGDEFQGLTNDPALAVECVLRGVRTAEWWTGIGIGRVELPLRPSVTESRGHAFYLAREAVERAKKEAWGFKIAAGDAAAADAVATVLQLIAFVVSSRGNGPRSRPTWKALEMSAGGLTHKAIATELGISRQAVSRRLQVAGHQEEVRGRALAEQLMERASAAT